MLTIYARANSVNVQKVLWCLAELDVPYERVDAGFTFGKNNEPWYVALIRLALPHAAASRLSGSSDRSSRPCAPVRAWRDRLAEGPPFRRHVMLPRSREL